MNGDDTLRIPNSFLTDYSSTTTELKTVCFIYSLISKNTKIAPSGNYLMMIKQSTIAKACGVTVITIKRTMARLIEKGFILNCERSYKANGELGTYIYEIKKVSLERNYFCLERNSLYALSGKLFLVYAFMCKLMESTTKSFYQSYSDLSKMIGFSRSEIMYCINLLIKNKFLIKYKKLTKANDYTDNTYYIIPYIRGKIYCKKKDSLVVSTNKAIIHIKNLRKYFITYIINHIYQFVKHSPKKLENNFWRVLFKRWGVG